jgi:UDP-galactopyranose mutase
LELPKMPERTRSGANSATSPNVLIVGGGLTGCTLAHRLALDGVATTILERSEHPGGLVRSDHMEGVLYEPHGSHIFHTEDQGVWELANEMTPFRPYRHRVDILADGQVLNWPILLSDIERQSRSEEIFAQLEARKDVDAAARAEASNFEDWCLDLMGPILYERFIKPYTEKQWGRPARELSAAWAPRRVSVRWDNDPYLFPESMQGWPAGPNGYTDLIEGLLDSDLITLHTGVDVSLDNLESRMAAADADLVVLTCPLDVFCSFELGTLEWRGILVRNVHVPHVDYAQGAMVVNYPGPEFPFIRVHETKHASGQVCEGTVLGFEFTNAPTRYYPIETERNRTLNNRYQSLLRDSIGERRTHFAGRLANYLYIDMDDCMRQALDAAGEVLEVVGVTV